MPKSKIIDLLDEAKSADKSTKTKSKTTTKSKAKSTTKSATKTVAKTTAKKTTTKKAATKKTTATKTTVKKTTTSATKTAKVASTSTVKKAASKTTAKKTAVKKSEPKTTNKTTAKKATTKTTTAAKKEALKKATKTTTVKKTTAKKATAKKATTTKAKTATPKKAAVKKTTTKKSTTKKVTKVEKDLEQIPFKDVPEYYDLPYRYNHTIVKLLAQNPTTLFVYWDLNDYDRNQLTQTYGENFFNETYPVLVIHNLTDNYTFEERIDDFANNWYIHVNDSKCTYTVELGRRPNEGQSITNNFNDLNTDYINLSWSNPIENPNDHVLFYKNHDKLYFKNIANNNVRVYEINLKDDAALVNGIYKNYNLSDQDDRFDMNNPSSGNPTSTLKAF